MAGGEELASRGLSMKAKGRGEDGAAGQQVHSRNAFLTLHPATKPHLNQAPSAAMHSGTIPSRGRMEKRGSRQQRPSDRKL